MYVFDVMCINWWAVENVNSRIKFNTLRLNEIHKIRIYLSENYDGINYEYIIFWMFDKLFHTKKQIGSIK